MSPKRLSVILTLMLAAILLAAAPAAQAQAFVQCRGDENGDAIPDPCFDAKKPKPDGTCPGDAYNPDYDPNVQCMHLSGGDGFAAMADGRPQYIFSFADLTGVPEEDAMALLMGAEQDKPEEDSMSEEMLLRQLMAAQGQG